MRNVKVCINNSYLGMVRQWQDLFHEGRYSEVYLGDSNPDFLMLARAYGIPGWRADNTDDLEGALDAWLDCGESALLEIVVPQEDAVFPMVPTGAALSEMIECEADLRSVTARGR